MGGNLQGEACLHIEEKIIILILRNFKVAVVVRTLVRMRCKRTLVRATLNSCQRQPNLMYRNFKLLFLPLDFVVSSVERWGRLGGGEGKGQSPSLNPSHRSTELTTKSRVG